MEECIGTCQEVAAERQSLLTCDKSQVLLVATVDRVCGCFFAPGRV